MNKYFTKRNVLILHIIAIFCAMLLAFLINNNIITTVGECGFKARTGLFCPSCGVTRCIINIFKLRFLEAFKFHPIFFCGIVYIIIADICFLYDLFREKYNHSWMYCSVVPVITYTAIYVLFYFLRVSLYFNDVSFDLFYVNI